MKISACQNTYTNAKLSEYILCLIGAQNTLDALERRAADLSAGGKAYADDREILRLSRAMDDAVVDIMSRRKDVDGILSAKAQFSA